MDGRGDKAGAMTFRYLLGRLGTKKQKKRWGVDWSHDNHVVIKWEGRENGMRKQKPESVLGRPVWEERKRREGESRLGKEEGRREDLGWLVRERLACSLEMEKRKKGRTRKKHALGLGHERGRLARLRRRKGSLDLLLGSQTGRFFLLFLFSSLFLHLVQY